MVADYGVNGGNQLVELSRRLKAAGESGKGLRRELFRSIQRATKPIRQEVQEAWSKEAPQRGGLAARRVTVQAKTRGTGRMAGVRLVTRSRDGYNLSAIDKGFVRHPVFGNRRAWGMTKIDSEILTRPQVDSAPQVRDEVVRAINRINQKVEGS